MRSNKLDDNLTIIKLDLTVATSRSESEWLSITIPSSGHPETPQTSDDDDDHGVRMISTATTLLNSASHPAACPSISGLASHSKLIAEKFARHRWSSGAAHFLRHDSQGSQGPGSDHAWHGPDSPA